MASRRGLLRLRRRRRRGRRSWDRRRSPGAATGRSLTRRGPHAARRRLLAVKHGRGISSPATSRPWRPARLQSLDRAPGQEWAEAEAEPSTDARIGFSVYFFSFWRWIQYLVFQFFLEKIAICNGQIRPSTFKLSINFHFKVIHILMLILYSILIWDKYKIFFSTVGFFLPSLISTLHSPAIHCDAWINKIIFLNLSFAMFSS